MNLLCGDCADVLKTLPDNSVDSLVTDPPAGIAFMGKAWDSDKGGRKEWCAWMEGIMREVLRVMKPGAHGLVWALPRTSHWTATALEDAGFEVRDCITHLFGSGFPKSLDVSKAIDKAAGAQREHLRPNPNARKAQGNYALDGESSNFKATYNPITAPSTDAAKQWQGFGTALKPAAEFWYLVRKPLSEKTVAANVLKWGTGGLNIDGSRIGTQDMSAQWDRTWNENSGELGKRYSQSGLESGKQVPPGRFPANLILSHSPYCSDTQCDIECAVSMLDAQSGHLHGRQNKKVKESTDNGMFGNGIVRKNKSSIESIDLDKGGGASRFFYCAKISASERNAGLEGMPEKFVATMNGGIGGMEHNPDEPTAYKKNHHPTVKPQKLMRYLCKLVTPPGGTVLDPFMGSGSTGLAAKSEGFGFVGIEREAEYFEIAKARIAPTINLR